MIHLLLVAFWFAWMDQRPTHPWLGKIARNIALFMTRKSTAKTLATRSRWSKCNLTNVLKIFAHLMNWDPNNKKNTKISLSQLCERNWWISGGNSAARERSWNETEPQLCWTMRSVPWDGFEGIGGNDGTRILRDFIPIASMGMVSILMVNVGNYTIHGCYVNVNSGI